MGLLHFKLCFLIPYSALLIHGQSKNKRNGQKIQLKVNVKVNVVHLMMIKGGLLGGILALVFWSSSCILITS